MHETTVPGLIPLRNPKIVGCIDLSLLIPKWAYQLYVAELMHSNRNDFCQHMALCCETIEYLADEKMVALHAPNVDMATNTGISHQTGGMNASAQVWNRYNMDIC